MADSWLILGALEPTGADAWAGELAYEGSTYRACVQLEGDTGAGLWLGTTAAGAQPDAHLNRRTAASGVDYLTGRVTLGGDVIQVTAFPNRAGGLQVKYVASPAPIRQPAYIAQHTDEPDAAAAALSKLRSRRNAQADPF